MHVAPVVAPAMSAKPVAPGVVPAVKAIHMAPAVVRRVVHRRHSAEVGRDAR